MKTVHLGNGTMVELANVAYYFSTDTVNNDVSDFDFYTPTSLRGAMIVGDKKIVPEGTNNRLPDDIRDLLEKSHIGEGILNRQRGLQLGQGIQLYKEECINGLKQRNYLNDKNIEDWLSTWDYQNYIINCLIDFLHRPQYFSLFVRNRGPRAGLPGKIKYLKHIPEFLCRREYPNTVAKLFGEPSYILVKDWNDFSTDNSIYYPGIDFADPFKNKLSAMWVRLYQYGRTNRYEVIPQWYGSIRWMRCGSNVPEIINNLNKNMLNIKWHIISPKAYWDNKREMLMEQCTKDGKDYNDAMLEKLKDDILTGLSRVLSGIENVGKFFHSESVMEVLELGKAQLMEWKIIPIDQKVDDYIKSQILVGEKADSAATSGMGLHPSLSNIIINGKLASGSEMLYAYKLFLATDSWLVDQKVFEALNYAIKLNFNTDIKAGFYHDIVKREENLAPADRVMSNDN